jgi:hypothetical protein
MAQFRGRQSAFGSPGCEPRWTDADKDGIGTAFSGASPIWFTIRKGIVTEVYYPTVDRPQLRDLQFLFADVDIAADAFAPRVEFTFFWKDANAWEGRNYQVEAY